MAFVTVAELKTTLGLGSLYADADLQDIAAYIASLPGNFVIKK